MLDQGLGQILEGILARGILSIGILARGILSIGILAMGILAIGILARGILGWVVGCGCILQVRWRTVRMQRWKRTLGEKGWGRRRTVY